MTWPWVRRLKFMRRAPRPIKKLPLAARSGPVVVMTLAEYTRLTGRGGCLPAGAEEIRFVAFPAGDLMSRQWCAGISAELAKKGLIGLMTHCRRWGCCAN